MRRANCFPGPALKPSSVFCIAETQRLCLSHASSPVCWVLHRCVVSYIPEQLGSLMFPGTAQAVLELSTCFAGWAVPVLYIAMPLLRRPKPLQAKRRELQRTSLTSFNTDTWWSEPPEANSCCWVKLSQINNSN